MARVFSREEILKRLQAQVNSARGILIFGAGSGLSAKCADEAGADIIAIYSTAILRMKGIPSLISSLPYDDANRITLETAREILPLLKDTPVICGLGAHDPRIDMERMLEQVCSMGFSGVANEPFAGSYGGKFADILERAGLGFSKEVQMIKAAREAGLFTIAWCVNAKEAAVMAGAGADIVGAMVMGDCDSEESFEAALNLIREMCAAAKAVRKDIMVITHGGPFMDFETASRSVRLTPACGYAAGSSGERISTQNAITKAVAEYKSILAK